MNKPMQSRDAVIGGVDGIIFVDMGEPNKGFDDKSIVQVVEPPAAEPPAMYGCPPWRLGQAFDHMRTLEKHDIRQGDPENRSPAGDELQGPFCANFRVYCGRCGQGRL